MEATDRYGRFWGWGRGAGAGVAGVRGLGFAGTIIMDDLATNSGDPGRGGPAKRDAGVSAGIAAAFFLSESGCTDAAGLGAPGDTGGGATRVAIPLLGMTATAAGGRGADGGGTSFGADGATDFAGVDGGVVVDCAVTAEDPNTKISGAKILIDIMVSP